MKNQPDRKEDLPFSRPFKVEDMREKTVDLEITATAAEREALARSIGFPDIASFSAKFQIAPGRRGRFEVTGEVRARLTQVCVVTLESFDSDLREEVEATFAPQDVAEKAAARFAARPEDDVGDLNAEEPPDPIIDGRIDLGVVAMEFLVLGLDPYPRKPGVEFKPVEVRPADAAGESPFAALARLKAKDEG